MNDALNKIRLGYQHLLSAIAIPLGFNHRLVQFCDRCGRTRWGVSWWDHSGMVWEAVAGNINGHRHGCFCPKCFTELARENGIYLIWKPTIEKENSSD